MKKLLLSLTVFLLLMTVVTAPQARAQEENTDNVETIDVTTQAEENQNTTETQSTESSETAKTPDTGIAPSNKAAASITVFVGGALLGAALGYGIIQLKKRSQN